LVHLAARSLSLGYYTGTAQVWGGSFVPSNCAWIPKRELIF
jgi:hypothetical protein